MKRKFLIFRSAFEAILAILLLANFLAGIVSVSDQSAKVLLHRYWFAAVLVTSLSVLLLMDADRLRKDLKRLPSN